MNTSTPLDPRSLAHRLTSVGHTLHHRLFAQLRDSGLPPKTVFLLRAIDGRIEAPWIAERLARGGKRVSALVEPGWIAHRRRGWALADEGRAVLDRVDATARRCSPTFRPRNSSVSSPPSTRSKARSASTGATATARAARVRSRVRRRSRLRALRARLRSGTRGFGPASVRTRPLRAPRARRRARLRARRRSYEHGGHGFAHDSAHGERTFAHGEEGTARRITGHGCPRPREHHRAGHGRGCDPRVATPDTARSPPGHRHDDRRSAQRAYERGFDAGFSRGREASASGDAPASA